MTHLVEALHETDENGDGHREAQGEHGPQGNLPGLAAIDAT
ncbi:hypothetical protein [Streptomyces sp. HJ7]